MNLESIALAVRVSGCAWNGGAGGDFLIIGTRSQLEAFVAKITEVQSNRITAMEQELRTDEKLLAHREELLDAIPQCPQHGPGCVSHAIEWVQRMKETPTDAMWAASLNRRGQVEQLMFDAARGKRPMPTAQELREWALKLGTVHEHVQRAQTKEQP